MDKRGRWAAAILLAMFLAAMGGIAWWSITQTEAGNLGTGER